MSNAGSASVGASPKYAEIDLTSDTPPITFKAVFVDRYPTMDPNRSFISRTIVAIDAGTLTVIDCDGDQVELTFAAGQALAIQATGIHATTIDGVQVLL